MFGRPLFYFSGLFLAGLTELGAQTLLPLTRADEARPHRLFLGTATRSRWTSSRKLCRQRCPAQRPSQALIRDASKKDSETNMKSLKM
eukprot:3861830-Rhodomonas_salina.1